MRTIIDLILGLVIIAGIVYGTKHIIKNLDSITKHRDRINATIERAITD